MVVVPEILFTCNVRNVDARRMALVQEASVGILGYIAPGADLRALPLQIEEADPKLLDLLFPVTALLEDGFPAAIDQCLGHRTWLEILPSCLDMPRKDFFKRVARLIEEHGVLPVLGSVHDLSDLLALIPSLPGCVLRGNEAAGFAGQESTFSLFTAAHQLLADRELQPSISVWGGIGSAEAVAAFCAAGAAGVVLESLHWGTDWEKADEKWVSQLSRLLPDHFSIVGEDVKTPCRFFDKGNSKAIKQLQKYVHDLSIDETKAYSGALFHAHVKGLSSSPSKNGFSSKELAVLGVEAAFAAPFAEQYGTQFVPAIAAFKKDIERCRAMAKDTPKHFQDSEAARAMGTAYPVWQGAMCWISDNIEFALAVAKSGGMPTFSLGMMSRKQLVEHYGNLETAMEGHPFAVNILALAENPSREQQLQWVLETRPPFVVIAAGEPQFARHFQGTGITAVYSIPSVDLFEIASRNEVRYFICEGNESGGHNGEHSTFTLAQSLLRCKREQPALFEGRTIIMAGGICNRLGAVMMAMLGADAVQMGTAYLTTQEIVSSQALSKVFQEKVVHAGLESTLVTGQTVGLRVRSLANEKIVDIQQLEKRFVQGLEDEHAFRSQLELLAAGSLQIAARGYGPMQSNVMSEEECAAQGQFMSGVCSQLLHRVQSLEELHHEVVAGPWRPLVSHEHAASERPEKDDEGIVITGLGIVNSLATDPEHFIAASLGLKSGVREVADVVEHFAFFFDPKPMRAGWNYSKVGAFMDLEVTRKDLGVSPQDFKTMSTSTKVTLLLAKQAIEGSGLLEAGIPSDRIGVVVSQNSGESTETLADLVIQGAFPNIMAAVEAVKPLTKTERESIRSEFRDRFLGYDDTTMLGRLSFTASGHISNKYGFEGPSQAVTAACASSLAATHVAVQMLRNNLVDAVLVGGGDESLSVQHYLEFSAIGALSGGSGKAHSPDKASRPFDAARNGMVLGEGGAMVVLERESVARGRGAHIHARLVGVGGGNSSDGIVESSHASQMRAIRASFADAGYGPETVDLVECHATSTQQGDLQEVLALCDVYGGKEGRTILASLKSQTGHTLGSAGLSSLIRGVLAMNAGMLPATLNFHSPDPAMGLEDSELEVLTAPESWPASANRPRRLQVNAFGFGGANYVLQVEQVQQMDTRQKAGGNACLGVTESSAGDATAALQCPVADGIGLFSYANGIAQLRIAMVGDDGAQMRSTLEGLGLSSLIKLSPRRRRTLAKQSIFVGDTRVAPPNLALVFPGQGSQYAHMGKELYQAIPTVREWVDKGDELSSFSLRDCLFEAGAEELKRTSRLQPCLFVLEYALAQWLLSMGLKPKVVAGHSLGELTALCVAQVFSFEDGLRLVERRGQWMEAIAGRQTPASSMLATDASGPALEALIAGHPGVCVSNVNAPNQMVLGGPVDQLVHLETVLKEQGQRAVILPVSMAFHSPSIRKQRGEWETALDGMTFSAPALPVIANTTGQRYPQKPQEIRALLLRHAENQVLWMESVRCMADEFGVTHFLECGPREVLGGLVESTLPEAVNIATCLPSVEMQTARNGAALLGSMGALDWQAQPLEPEQEISPAATVRAESSQSFQSSQSSQSSQASPSSPQVQQIVQSEINRFMLQCFGHVLMPNIQAALKDQGYADVSESDMDVLMRTLMPEGERGAAGAVQAATFGEQIPAAATSGKLAEATTAPAQSLDAVQQQIIEAIMGATGYEADEIEVDMDLREDLSIRSSRLPVIMDELERRFGLQFHMEDFIDARSVRDLADIIFRLMADGGAQQKIGATPQAPPAEVDDDALQVQRVVFAPEAAEEAAYRPLVLQPMDVVAIVHAPGSAALAGEVEDVCQRDYGAESVLLEWASMFDPAKEQARSVREIQAVLRDHESLSGLIIVLDGDCKVESGVSEPGVRVAMAMEGVGGLMQAGLGHKELRFALVVGRALEPQQAPSMLFSSATGLCLSAALEQKQVVYRTLLLDSVSEVATVLRDGLNLARTQVERIFSGDDCKVMTGRAAPYCLPHSSTAAVGSKDVFVFTGGGRGITPSLALGLLPFGCKVVLLGRSGVGDPAGDPAGGTEPDDSRRKEVLDTVARLRGAGLNAEYRSCDVRDAAQCDQVFAEIAAVHGCISGVVHGAGVLRNGLLEDLTPEDWRLVMAVKVQGACNVFRAAQAHGLKYFLALSSVSAVLGNRGQPNYSAANRLMSEALRNLGAALPKVKVKSICLPPVEGAGMAEQPLVRAYAKRFGIGYVHMDELASLLVRELFLPPDEKDILYVRTLPDYPTGPRMELSGACATAAATCFTPAAYPLVDAIRRVDLRRKELVAERRFSLAKDLWLGDHKPVTGKDAMLSTVMFVEMLLETGALFMPCLSIRGVRDVQLLAMVECPPGVEKALRIDCRHRKLERGENECLVSVSGAARTPGAKGETVCRGVVLSGARESAPFGPDGTTFTSFAFTRKDVVRSCTGQEIRDIFLRHTRLEGRYLVLEECHFLPDGRAWGVTLYREEQDFAAHETTCYQYSPYVLEAMLHLVGITIAAGSDEEREGLLPLRIGELRFARACAHDERIEIEVVPTGKDGNRITYDARALDEAGQTIVVARGVEMLDYKG